MYLLDSWFVERDSSMKKFVNALVLALVVAAPISIFTSAVQAKTVSSKAKVTRTTHTTHQHNRNHKRNHNHQPTRHTTGR